MNPKRSLWSATTPAATSPRRTAGIQTAYVGNGTPVRATWAGSMAKFADSFNEIEERFYERREQAAAANAHASNV